MRKMTIRCDRCGSEIPGDPYKIITEQIDRESGDWTSDPEPELTELQNLDFCRKCIGDVISQIRKSLLGGTCNV